jgi:hypothetical protein
MWVAVDADGRNVVVPPPVPFRDGNAKDLATAMVRAFFEIAGVTRYVFMTEAWTLDAQAPQGLDLDALGRDGVSDHPQRREAVMLIAESVNGGMVFGRRPIIRPSRGKARLGPLTIDQHDHVEGRMEVS